MDDDRLTLSVRRYDAARGAVADVEGGNVTITLNGGEVSISGDAAGLRDLARWCLVISDDRAPQGVHIHLDPDVVPMTASSMPM
jgi:hypothetical protein